MDPLQSNVAEIYKRTWRVLYLVRNELDTADVPKCMEKVKRMLLLLDELIETLGNIKNLARRNIPIETVEVIVKLSQSIVQSLAQRTKLESTNEGADEKVDTEEECRVYDLSTLFKIAEYHVESAMQDIRIEVGETDLKSGMLEEDPKQITTGMTRKEATPEQPEQCIKSEGVEEVVDHHQDGKVVVETGGHHVLDDVRTLDTTEWTPERETVEEDQASESQSVVADVQPTASEILEVPEGEMLEVEALEDKTVPENAPEGRVLEELEEGPQKDVNLEDETPEVGTAIQNEGAPEAEALVEEEERVEEDIHEAEPAVHQEHDPEAEALLEVEMVEEDDIHEAEVLTEESQESDTEQEDHIPRRALLEYLPIVIYVKSIGDKVAPIDSSDLFNSQKIQIPELTDAYQDYFQLIHDFVVTVPEGERAKHFEDVDRWQTIPQLMKKRYNSNFFTMDSARTFEALVAGKEQLFPVASSGCTSSDHTYNICFICPPSGGAVVGTNTFLEANCRDLKVEWTAFTMHPWKESVDLDDVVYPDHILHQEPERWRFVLNDSMDIVKKEDVKDLVLQIKMTFPNKVDLVIADLSPALIDMEVGRRGLNFIEQVRTALFTEAGEVEVALRTLKNGGSLVLTMMNPVDHISSIGIIGFLCGLFSAVTVVIPRSSSTWLKPVNLIFSGFLGFEVFVNNYPNFADNFISSVALNTVSGNKVMLDISSLTVNAVKEGIVKMGKELIREETERITFLVDIYENNFMTSDELCKEKLEVAASWISELQNYVVLGNIEHVNRVKNILPQCCSSDEEFKLAKHLNRTEMQSVLVGDVDPVLTRLRKSYFDNEEGSSSVAFMNVLIDTVDTLNWESAVKEKFDFTSSFSRFTSIKLTYDFMIARFLGIKFPITGYSKSIGSAIQNPCICHSKQKVLTVLASDGFQFTFEEKLLHILCAYVPACERIKMSDGEFHQRTCDMILKDMRQRDRRDSLYVCRLPLSSRLLLGVVCLLTNCFDETRLIIDPKSRTVGVLLRSFKGQNNLSVRQNLQKVQSLVADLEADRPVNMEIVPIRTMMSAIDLESVIKYNDVVVLQEIRPIVNVLVSALNENRKEGPLREH